MFVDGCYWHGCPEHGTKAKTNASYWGPKIDRNIERDRETNELLQQAGWRVIRVWEHQDPRDVATAISLAVRENSGTQ